MARQMPYPSELTAIPTPDWPRMRPTPAWITLMSTRTETTDQPMFPALCWTQGIYYLITGLWPLISIRSFKAVTGEKNDNLPSGLDIDHWLVMTVGVLVTSIAVTLIIAAYRR